MGILRQFLAWLRRLLRGPIVIPEPSAIRNDLLYGYYLTSPTQVEETRDHVNLIWVGGPWGDDTAIANMQVARLPTVYDVSDHLYVFDGAKRKYNPDAESSLRAHFQRLADLDLLRYIAVIYPVDEPDISVHTEQDVRQANATARKVMAEFRQLGRAKLAVIYANGPRWCIEDFDVVATDSYGDKEEIFAEDGIYTELVKLLRPDQKTMIVSGGSFGQDPKPFFNYAQSDPRVWAMISFLWADASGIQGIRSGAWKDAYVKYGRRTIAGK